MRLLLYWKKVPGAAVVATVNDTQNFNYKDMSISMEEALNTWTGTLERVFPTRATEEKEEVKTDVFDTKRNIHLQE